VFEALETGKKIKSSEFSELRQALRPQLVKAQFELRERDYPVFILMAGFDGAGKGAVVHRLNEWMDPRLIETSAFWMHSDEEESRPFYWRFWRRMPPRGRIGIFLQSWYTEPSYKAMEGKLSDAEFGDTLREIEAFERMLTDDGALLIKIWLHVSRQTQRMQLAEEAPKKQQNPRVPADPENWWKRYPRAIEVAEIALKATDTSHSPWHLVEAEDSNYRDITVAGLVLDAMQERARLTAPERNAARVRHATSTNQPTILDRVDLDLTLTRTEYRDQIDRCQAELQDLAWQAFHKQRSVVAVFEGWDAAGKGSAIRRVTGAMDPRLYHLVQFAAPTDEERAHHYLWRFWRQIERDGIATLFDRSWYGRVLVERVEGFARPDEWQRAYNEINQFESQLREHGTIVIKYWLHISQDEQLRRFEARAQEPHKQHKITEEDWRNREKWRDYELAVEDMVTHTSTREAPWTLVPGNDKLYARIHILKAYCDALRAAL
jgi:polyphosphate:AMP phosphotransferase